MSGPLHELRPAAGTAVEALVEQTGLRGAAGPRLIAAMVGSIDGRATVDGRAGGLSSPVDRSVLRGLRAAADALLVGSGTLLAECYANLLDEPHRAERTALGLPATPVMVTISRSLRPELAQIPLFAERGQRIVVCTESDSELEARGGELRIERFEPGTLNARGALERARGLGLNAILSEGGPTLLHELLRERLVDELVLTLSAKLVAGEGRSVIAGEVLDPPLGCRLVGVLQTGDDLVLRYAPQR